MKVFIPCKSPVASSGISPVMVRDALSKRVLIFGWLGFLTYRAWLPAMLAAIITILAWTITPLRFQFPALLILHIILAVFTPEIRLWDLKLHGKLPGNPIAAPDRNSAIFCWATRPAPPLQTPPELPCASS